MANVSKGRQSQLPRKGAGTVHPHEKCTVGERLYSQVHVCNHARCAANDPDYNVKSVVPPKKFLVARRHVYGGLEEKGEKKRTTDGSSTTSADHHSSRSHAHKSSTGRGSNGKVRSNCLPSNVRSSALQTRRATRDNSCISSDTKKVVERKGRPTSTHSSSTVPSRSPIGRSCLQFTQSNSRARKSPLSSAGSGPSSTVTEQSKQWESSTSPASSITSIRITQIVATRREEQEEGEDESQELAAAAAVSSPTASVGSNHDTEIASLKETLKVVEEVGMLPHETSNFQDFQNPASSASKLLHKYETKEADWDSPQASPLVDRPPVSEFLTPSPQSTSVTSTAPAGYSLASTPASELSSSSLQKIAVGKENITLASSSSFADSRFTMTGPLSSSVTSLMSGPRLSSTSTVGSFRMPSSSDKLSRKLLSKLEESSKVGSPLSSSSRALTIGPLGISKRSAAPALVVSSLAPAKASTLAERFITDSQVKSASRRSTRGVRSIELRGGKAQSYSTTTVTSWNVTTTTVETSSSTSVSEITSEKNVQSGSAIVEATSKPEQSSNNESGNAPAHKIRPTPDPKAIQDAPTTLKVAKNVRTFEKAHVEPETVALKHGEVAERRLSEEYMTNHALEGVVRKIAENDRRVKVLVNAFETLATLSDGESLAVEEKASNQQLAHGSLSARTIAV